MGSLQLFVTMALPTAEAVVARRAKGARLLRRCILVVCGWLVVFWKVD